MLVGVNEISRSMLLRKKKRNQKEKGNHVGAVKHYGNTKKFERKCYNCRNKGYMVEDCCSRKRLLKATLLRPKAKKSGMSRLLWR